MNRLILAFCLLIASTFAQAQELTYTREPSSYLWANRPACGSGTNQVSRIFISDVGVGGSLWRCDGTEWQPLTVIVLGRSAVSLTNTNSTNSVEFNQAVVTLPAGIMGLNRGIDVEAFWSFTGSTNNKQPIVRWSTSSGATTGGTLIFNGTAVASNIAERARGSFRNRNLASSDLFANILTIVFGGFGTVLPFYGTTDSTAATYINFNAIKTLGTETMTLESYDVRLVP